ncbi:hypothetical protein PUN28_018330 [Cardiocondyla obscurior]|uniref:Uncharacterized protein n=1 Tax=Cardiocondyla obscurior TaxID=286306 RepID=A0AAW2EID7_9HYME
MEKAVNTNEIISNNRKRKKKLSYGQTLKKFARRESYSAGLDQDTYQYLIRILDVIRDDSLELEEKTMLMQNVYGEISGHEIECACNRIGSLVIDRMLNYVNLETIQNLVQTFETSLRRLVSERFASYVLQKVIIVCADRGNRVSTPDSSNSLDEKTNAKSKDSADSVVEVQPFEVQSYNEIVLKLSKFVLNNGEEFIFDAYANYIMRTAIQCLGGLIESPNEWNKKFIVPDLTKRRSVIQEYKDLLVQSCDRLQKWPQFCQFGHDQMTSGVLQCILYSLKDVDPDLTKTIVKKIIKQSFKTDEKSKLSNIFNAECSNRVVEACLTIAQPKTFKKVYKTLFADNLEYLCLTHSTNFGVQKLLDNCNDTKIFQEIFAQLTPHFSKILEQGFTGILLSTANACLRLQTEQGPFVYAMMKLASLSSENQKQIVQCLITLKPVSQLSEADPLPPFHLHGSLITQAILKFNKPIIAVNSLLEMNEKHLLQLCQDPKGSRVVDAFMDSAYVGEKSREKLFKRLQGTWVTLVCNVYGSRCVDKMWARANMNQKIAIMNELVKSEYSLRLKHPSKYICAKLNLPLFAFNQKKWMTFEEKKNKTKELFEDIIAKPAK